MKNNIAKIIRILSIPPIMISALVLILANSRADVFHDGKELLIILLLLGLVPLLAYPFLHMFPSLLKKGRAEQRKLAFIFTLVGYLAVQGAFIEHQQMMERLGWDCIQFRKKEDRCYFQSFWVTDFL